MKLDIEERVALVVGASRGIGFAIADTLAAEGAKVAIAARGVDGVKSAADRIGRGASCHAADVTNPAAARALASDGEKQWGKIDILICNVGSGTSVPPGKETAAEWSRVMDINLFATTNTIEAARPLMSRGNGDVVEKAEAHRRAALGMVPRWTHHGHGAGVASAEHPLHGVNGGARRQEGRFVGFRRRERVGIERNSPAVGLSHAVASLTSVLSR